MANTTNFNWETPDDTDLVKDGAAAIRTLGNSIDTSFVDLKGGTTGQILSKASNTDLDYTWIANDQGDITEVQAGTGISVASGTGPIPVVTNTVATAYDAKADLIVGTGADTFSRLAVGANNTVLTADSSVSPTGLKWAASATGQAAAPTCTAYTNGNLTYTGGTPLNFTYTSEETDTDGFHNNSTNTDRITIPTGFGGVYVITISYLVSGSGSSYFFSQIQKNGANMNGTTVASETNGRGCLTIIAALAAADYVTASVQISATGTFYTERRFSVTRVGL